MTFLTHIRQVRQNGYFPNDMLTLVENLVSALRGVFAERDVSVSFSPIPRSLSPSTPTTSQISVVKSEGHIVDVNPSLGSSEDISPILYVGPSSRGLTNLLMTHPTTPVCIRSAPLMHPTRAIPIFLLFQGLWI